LGIAASAAVTVVVAAIVLIGHGSGPRAASRATRNEARLVELLGALRQPQTSADRTFRRLVLPLPRTTAGSDIEPDWSLVRLATVTPWGAKVFLVPARPRNAVLARDQGLVIATWVQGVGWSDLSFASDIPTGNDWGPGATVPLRDGGKVSRFFEVVPDGVARVTFYDLRRLPRAGEAARPIGHVSATVHNNVAAFQDPKPGLGVVLAIWYAPDGRVIKRIGDWKGPLLSRR